MTHLVTLPADSYHDCLNSLALAWLATDDDVACQWLAEGRNIVEIHSEYGPKYKLKPTPLEAFTHIYLESEFHYERTGEAIFYKMMERAAWAIRGIIGEPV